MAYPLRLCSVGTLNAEQAFTEGLKRLKKKTEKGH